MKTFSWHRLSAAFGVLAIVWALSPSLLRADTTASAGYEIVGATCPANVQQEAANGATASWTCSAGGATATGSATADNGALHAYASAINPSGSPLGTTAIASAQASFSDVITINGGSGTGYIIVPMTVDGSITCDVSSGDTNACSGISGSYEATANLKVGNGATTLADNFQAGLTGATGPVPYSDTLSNPEEQFTFGVTPINMSGTLLVQASSDSSFGAVTAITDFSDTAAIGPIEVFDSNGNLLTDVTIASASGTVYQVAGENTATASESPTLPLLGIGLLVLFAASWRKQQVQLQSM